MTRARDPNIGSTTDPTLWNWFGYENMTGPLDTSGTLDFGFTDVETAQRWQKALTNSSIWLHGYFK